MYRARLTDPLTGRRISLTRPTKLELAAAKARVQRIFRDYRAGDLTAREVAARLATTEGGPLTVGALWLEYRASIGSSWAASAESTWTRHLAPAFAHVHPSELTEARMARWYRATRTAGLAATSAYVAFGLLRTALRRGVQARRLPELPWGAWTPRKGARRVRPSLTSIEDLELLLRAAHAADAEGAGDLLFRIGSEVLCGLRQGESAGLGWDCVFLEADVAHVVVRYQVVRHWRALHPDWSRPRAPPKGRKERRIPLSSSTRALFAAQRARLLALGLYADDGPVFPATNGGWRTMPLLITTAELRHCAHAAGLPEADAWVPHGLRHTYVTLEARGAVALGGSLAELREHTGHSDVRTLEGYLHAGEMRSFLPPLTAGIVPGDAGFAALDVDGLVRRVPIEAEILPALAMVPRAAPRSALAPPPKASAPRASAADQAYSRAYHRALREKKTPTEARRIGRRARRAFVSGRVKN